LAANRAKHQSALIATDGVFSMDGDLAPLSDLSTLAQRFDAWLLADDAHGLGVPGDGRHPSFTSGADAETEQLAATVRRYAPGAFAP
jgi:8-amino-7-oxononanoate synthase